MEVIIVKNHEKTIAAIATPLGRGGVAVIRISGDSAAEVADRVFKGKTPVSESMPYLMQYGSVFDKEGKLLDKVLCVYMKGPHSFTGEDVVEIHTHGGGFSANKVLMSILQAGASTASPGEFTKRAFLNGKLDLVQAEAVVDIINSETDLSLYGAVNQLEGKLSKEINEIRSNLVNITAQIQVAADYPEEDIDFAKQTEFEEMLSSSALKLDSLIKTAQNGKIIREGISCAIVGRPNTGKSSLLNALLGEKRAIVTDKEGTTRDIIEEYLNIDGIIVKFADTAGIRKAEGEAEEIGVNMALEYIEKADLCLIVLDGSFIREEDNEILKIAERKKAILILNKNDIKEIDYKTDITTVSISAKTGKGIDKLKEEIVKMATDGEIKQGERAIITNMRHKEAAITSKDHVLSALGTIRDGFPVDLTAVDLEAAIDALGEITGITVSEEIIDKIFKEFCLGK